MMKNNIEEIYAKFKPLESSDASETERKGYIHAFYESKDSNTTVAMSNFLFNEAAHYMKEAVKAAEQINQSPKKGMKM